MIYKILLIEDDPAHVELISRAFARSSGFQLSVVRSLAQAKLYLNENQPDAVFIDFMLPDGSGTSLLSANEDERLFPVVILTSHGSEQVAVEAMKSGALDYVVKSEAVFADMPNIARRTLREWGHIVQRRRAERELRESEERFRKMLEYASEGVMLVQPSGIIVLVNRYIEHVFGYDRNEMVGQSVDMLLPIELRSRHGQYREEYRQVPHARPMGAGRDLMGLRKDGSTFPVEVSLSPINVSGNPLFMCLVIDITERKLLEEQRLYSRALEVELEKERELLELKERFIRLVSHQFRTPLSIIASTAEIMQHYYDSLSREKVSEKLESISDQVKRMVALMEDVLVIARGNAHRIPMEAAAIDIQAFCRRLVETAAAADGNRHLIMSDVEHNLSSLVADEQLLEHALLNLLSNATKYSPPDAPVKLRVYSQEDHWIFVVQDQGIGIPLGDQPRLFEPFNRAQNATHVKGTGLGLAIVKQNVEAMGGRVSFTSMEGEGTTFAIHLPVLNEHLLGE